MPPAPVAVKGNVRWTSFIDGGMTFDHRARFHLQQGEATMRMKDVLFGGDRNERMTDIGLLTRPAAFLLVGHFAIVVLVAHAGETFKERELPLLVPGYRPDAPVYRSRPLLGGRSGERSYALQLRWPTLPSW